MPKPEPSVLHVLPHPGGGGETYVDFLSEMPGYRSTRVYLAPSPTPTPSELVRGVAHAYRAGRDHDLLHGHGEVASGLCLPLLAARPSAVTLNGLHLLRRATGPHRTAAVLNLRALISATDQMICVSHAEHGYLSAVVGAGAGHRAVVIRNGVRLPPFVDESERTAVRTELGLDTSEPVGIWVGSLDERKDPLAAISAATTASVALLVVGDGPLRSQVEIATGDQVRVLGHRGDVPRLLASADFYVQTSHREGLALSLLEAMAHGVIPVVNHLPENVEAVGDAGIVVPSGDEAALVAALRRVGENERARADLGERARRRIDKLFNADEMIARTRAVYDDVLSNMPATRE